MITPEEEHLEETANLQIKVMTSVLKELQELAKVPDLPSEYYWFRYVDYAEVDRNGDLDCWSRGRGEPDTRSGYSLKVDPQLLADGDIEAFRVRFRASELPKFNALRTDTRHRIEAKLRHLQGELASLQGDIA